MVLFLEQIFALIGWKGIMLMKGKTDTYTHCKKYQGNQKGGK